MVAAAAVSTSFVLGTTPTPAKTPILHLGTNGIKSKPSVSSTKLLVVKVHAQARAPHQINEHAAVDLFSPDTKKNTNPTSSITQLPGSGALLAELNIIHQAAEKRWKLSDGKLVDSFSEGEIVDGGPVFRQNYHIRSYDLGPNRTATIQTLTNLIQETSLNHVRIRGILSDGFGSTPEMAKRNLIWVITKLHVVVDRYPLWGDVVEVDTWVGTSGKDSIHTNSSIRDCRTGEILARSTSVSVMMNKETRRLSKFPDEFKRETESFMLYCAPLLGDKSMKLPKLDDATMAYVRTGLSPIWNDLDVNQHVSHVKYTGWMLESVPDSIKKNHELAAITLEFRRECKMDSVLQSLTSVVDGATDGSAGVNGATDGSGVNGVKCAHILRLESEAIVAKGCSKWRPKHEKNTSVFGEVQGQTFEALLL